MADAEVSLENLNVPLTNMAAFALPLSGRSGESAPSDGQIGSRSCVAGRGKARLEKYSPFAMRYLPFTPASEAPMKLYDGKRTPNGRRVRIFIREKGLDLPEIVDTDIAKKEHLSPDYAKLNPKCRLPTLVLDDGTAMAESVAICRYFEEAHPNPPLFGTGPKGRALVEMWNRRVELGLFLSVATVFRHLSPFMADFEKPQVPAWGEANRRRSCRSCASSMRISHRAPSFAATR